MLQGKYINDAEVLREAASAAGIQDFERVLSDPTVALNQVRAEAIRVGSHWPHPDEVKVPHTHKRPELVTISFARPADSIRAS